MKPASRANTRELVFLLEPCCLTACGKAVFSMDQIITIFRENIRIPAPVPIFFHFSAVTSIAPSTGQTEFIALHVLFFS